MIDITTTQTALSGLVGWRQPASSTVPTIDAANLKADAGLYYNDVSGAVTLQNIMATCEIEIAADVSKLNAYLTAKTKASITKLVDRVLSRREMGDRNDVLESAVMYQQPTRWDDVCTLPATSFVGYEINMANRSDISAELTVILEFITAQANVPILIFDANKATATQQLISAVAKQQVFGTTSVQLRGSDRFYIGYLTSAITASVNNRTWDTASRKHIYHAAAIRPVQVTGHNSTAIFDISQVEYVSETWGLNFGLASYRDFTEPVKWMRRSFARGIQLQCAVDWMESFLTSPRSNRDERLVKEIQIELNGIEAYEMIPGKVGLIRQLDAEIKSLSEKLIKPSRIQTVTCTT